MGVKVLVHGTTSITSKQTCSYIFMYIQAHVLMYFLHLVPTFTPQSLVTFVGFYIAILKVTVKCIFPERY